MICRKCSKEIDEKSIWCKYCGDGIDINLPFYEGLNINMDFVLLQTPNPHKDVIAVDALTLNKIVNDQSIKKFLPAYSLLTNGEKYIEKLLMGFESRQQIAGFIRINKTYELAGLIVGTKISKNTQNEWFDENYNCYWHIEYFLSGDLRGRGIMTACLHNYLNYMNRNKVELTIFSIDCDNYASLRVMEKLSIKRTGLENGGKRWVYKCVLIK